MEERRRARHVRRQQLSPPRHPSARWLTDAAVERAWLRLVL